MSVYSGPNTTKDGLVLALDAANPKSFSVNVHPQPLDMFAWFNGTSGSCTIERDFGTSKSPAGGIPLKMAVTGNDPYMAAYNSVGYHLAPAAAGQTWTVSVWIKASTNTSAELFIFGDSAAGGNVFSIVDYGAGTVNVTTEWTRVSYSFTFSNASVARVQVRLDGPNSGGSGQTLWWDGLQVERSNTSTKFNPRANLNGAIWYDISNSGNNFSMTGSLTYNTAGYFDSTASTANYWQLTNFNIPTATLSLEMWVRCNTGATIDGLVSYASGGGDNNMLIYDPSNVSLYGPSGLVSSGVAINNNQWRQIVRTSNRFTGVEKLYINGALVLTGSLAIGTYFTTGGTIIIGQEQDAVGGGLDAGQALEGSYSVLKIWNRVLTDSEVTQSFNALKGRYSL